MALACTCSGHRPEKLPWRERIRFQMSGDFLPKIKAVGLVPTRVKVGLERADSYMQNMVCCDWTTKLEDRYGGECMRYMAEHLQILRTAFDGSNGGMTDTLCQKPWFSNCGVYGIRSGG